MGLFDKKTCAICGGKVKGLLPASFGGEYVCGDCLGNVHIYDDIRFNMNMDDFRKYREFREENQKLKDVFQITETYDFGIFFNKLFVDTKNNMFCLNSDLSTTIFKAEAVDYFTITEDGVPLYEGRPTGLNYYPSSVPENARALAPLIQQIRYEEMRHKDDDNYIGMRVDSPFEKFYITIYLKHPYWPSVEINCDGPFLNMSNPDIRDYVSEYHRKAEEMSGLAQVLMGLVEAGAKARGEAFTAAKAEEPSPAPEPAPVVEEEPAAEPEPVEEPAPAPAAPAAPAAETDVIAEIKKYKELFDLGAITEEEYAAKKKQIMGI